MVYSEGPRATKAVLVSADSFVGTCWRPCPAWLWRWRARLTDFSLPFGELAVEHSLRGGEE